MPDTKLFLIDAHALCYRAFFAIKGLTNSKGQPTNAVYGFLNILRKILREYNPQYAAVCFDVKGKTNRQAQFADYKIHRPVMPDDLISQISIIKKVVRAYRLPVFELEGFEADDVIATLAKKFTQKDFEVVIVSDDKDMYQLLNDRTKAFSSRKEGIVEAPDIKDLIGVGPEFIPDYIGLAGDSVDNIPGVKGIGQVTASKLIEEFGHLEDIYKNLDKIKSKSTQEKLREQKDMAFLSKELALLNCTLPLKVELEDLKVQPPDEAKLLEIFNELEFKRLIQEFSGPAAVAAAVAVGKPQSREQVKDLAEKIAKKKELAFLFETVEGAVPRMLVTLDEEVHALSLDEIAPFKALLKDPSVAKITYDVKETFKLLCEPPCEMNGEIFDVMLAGYLLSPGQTVYDLSAMAWQHLKLGISDATPAADRLVAVRKLYPILQREMKEKELLKLFVEIEIPLARVLSEMEMTGVCIDEDLLKKLSVEGEHKIDELLKKIYELAGEEFNLNSPKQLSVILFEKLKLPVVKKTKTGYSTDETVLNKLANAHPLVAYILEYRQIAKLKSTYIDALPKLLDPKTGRLHASFNQAGAETGRLSSQNPNLQNIPIRTDLGRQIRKAFVPSKKTNFILAADYSQIELRVLAHLSGDKELARAFQKDEDIHNYTAALIFEVPENEVTPLMRTTAKRVNFGIIYGMSAFGLSKDLAIPTSEAQDFIDRYFLRYPSVKKFMDEQIKSCEKEGYVKTLLNRRRYIPEINNPNIGIRQFAQRQAINTPVQGSAADLIKLAMIHIAAAIEKEKLSSRMIITVHDELVFDVPGDEEAAMVKLVRETMEKVLPLSVPIKVAVKKGTNWLETTQVKESV